MILALIIMVFIGQRFHALAETYLKEPKWVYSILGIASYFGSQVILGAFIAIIGRESLLDNFGFSFIAGLTSGLLGTLTLYKIFEYQWKKNDFTQKTEIEELGKDILNEEEKEA